MSVHSRYIMIVLCISLFGCQKDNAFGPQSLQSPSELLAGKAVYIGCEGNFGLGNASLSIYYPDSQRIVNDAYASANGRPLGDVLQSLLAMGDTIVAVINNSEKIILLNTDNLLRISEIIGFNSPRYCVKIPGNRLLVSDLYSNVLYVVDISAGSIVGTIPLNGWNEQMVRIEHLVYISNLTRNLIYVLDLDSETIVDSIELDVKPVGLALGKRSIYIAGPTVNSPTASKLYQFGAFGIQHIADIGGEVTRLSVSPDTTQVALLSNTIHILDTDDWAATSIDVQGNPYSLGYSESTDEIYVLDARDFTSPGRLRILTKQGIVKGTFETGIIPQAILK